MVQGGFLGGLNDNRLIKQEGCFEQQRVHFCGGGFGFREERFGQSPMGKKFDNSFKVDEAGQEGQSPNYKRAKYQQQLSPLTTETFSQCLLYNPLEEPSPLGLTLKKTPSFLDLIETKLSQGDWAVPAVASNPNHEIGTKKDVKSIIGHAANDKLKASNFPASFLRIGLWERVSRYEGDLVAKCYYAKRKLVWEVLEGGLKSKIEIQWSDITSLKASYPENEPGTLEIEVSKPPTFCRETNPLPRKHTLWQPFSDFTGGQASICRRHFLHFNPGILERHFEKLIQCDHRLNLLSKGDIISDDSPYFSSSTTVFQVSDEENCYGVVKEHKSHLIPQFDHLKDNYPPPFSTLSDRGTHMVPILVPKFESVESDNRGLEVTTRETPSPISVMDLRTIEENGTSDTDELHINVNAQCIQQRFRSRFSGLQNQGSGSLPSKSMKTLVNQIGSCFAEKQCFPLAAEDSCPTNRKILCDIARHLLSDSHVSVASDEKTLMARVNSMASLIQQDISAVQRLPTNTSIVESSRLGYGQVQQEKGADSSGICQRNDTMATVLNRDCNIPFHANSNGDHMQCQQTTGIPRQDSIGEYLMNLSRISSFSQLFVDNSDEQGEQAGEIAWNKFR